MSRKKRWIASIATGALALPAGYAATFLLCGSSPIARLIALANALTLTP